MSTSLTTRFPVWLIVVVALAVGALVVGLYWLTSEPAGPSKAEASVSAACRAASLAQLGGVTDVEVSGETTYLIAGDPDDGRYSARGRVEARVDGEPRVGDYACEVRRVDGSATVTQLDPVRLV